MAALAPANNTSADKKRVKVYELKNNDWYDRGTGFCEGKLLSGANAQTEELDARVVVTSEEEPERVLLETRIAKDDGYQKQQETLIVWTESSGVDMALSFQEADGCAQIWQFVSDIQGRLVPEDGLSDDLLGPEHTVSLPEPTIGKLEEVVDAIRQIANTPAGRDALSKYIMSPDQMYILKLAPVLKELEENEEVQELHRLCTIMKHIILLNDTSIIEFIVTDQAIMGVVGALEYDPDFPSHRANHRQFLSDKSKFKEVVKFDHPDVTKKIHYTYRLLYLKDVVLARILDDPTFSVLNSLIFFHQVDIINHLQGNRNFLHDLFAIFTNEDEAPERKKQACLFIQNCCAVSKTIQAPARAQLYANFIHHGLFNTITYALRHHDAAVRVAGTDVLVSLIDHDAHVVRNHIIKALHEKTVPLTDVLIELLLVEVDLGVKSQMADAIKILLDPTSTQAGMDAMNRAGNAEMMKRGGPGDHPGHRFSPQANTFIQNFYEFGAKRLFKPLKDLEGRESMRNLTVQETSLYTHLVEVLSFFVRQHAYQCKLFILSENLHSRIAQLLECPQKHMKLIALKWFRTCIGLQDEFHNRQLTNNKLFEPILNIVYETMPRDNLLNSCCLELFEYIKREGIKQIIYHLVETYRDRLMNITYVNTFQGIVQKFDQYNNPFVSEREGDTSFTTEPDTPDALRGRMTNGRQAFSGLKEDADEDAYFNADDDLDGEFGDDEDGDLPSHAQMAKLDAVMSNGHANSSSNASPMKALVNYADDDEDDEMDLLASSPDILKEKKSSSSAAASEPNASTNSPDGQRGRSREPRNVPDSPPEPMAVKRRRAEVDDDDELGKMMGGSKRRNSSASLNSAKGGLAAVQLDGTSEASQGGSPLSVATDKEADPEDLALASPKSQSMSPVAGGHTPGPKLRRKGSLKVKNEGATNPGRYAIKPIDITNGRRGEPDGKKSNGGADG
ncbi:putative PH-like domain superfamily protein [Septoria linicola]|nr:putative PH-like domain superfamily protein [Septoria linicola]